MFAMKFKWLSVLTFKENIAFFKNSLIDGKIVESHLLHIVIFCEFIVIKKFVQRK